jgi:hypothetical protein
MPRQVLGLRNEQNQQIDCENLACLQVALDNLTMQECF